jgi:suppressor for copper-sensitivity B
MDYLRKNNRFAIPFNAVYGPKAPNGIILSELLTKDELLAAIKKAQ